MSQKVSICSAEIAAIVSGQEDLVEKGQRGLLTPRNGPRQLEHQSRYIVRYSWLKQAVLPGSGSRVLSWVTPAVVIARKNVRQHLAENGCPAGTWDAQWLVIARAISLIILPLL